MGAVERQTKLFEQILLLRRAELQAPRVPEIADVRSQLEDELGGGVSMRMTGRLLGVSDATIRRWVSSGDLPTVIDLSGKQIVPVGFLADLRAEADQEREAGRSHVLEPSMLRWRGDAEALSFVNRPPHSDDRHDRAAARALAYHQAVAAKLHRDGVDEALRRVWSWRSRGRIDPRHADQWDQLLHRPLAEVRERITAEGPEARDLRQNSPFAGTLSEAERRRIFEMIP